MRKKHPALPAIGLLFVLAVLFWFVWWSYQWQDNKPSGVLQVLHSISFILAGIFLVFVFSLISSADNKSQILGLFCSLADDFWSPVIKVWRKICNLYRAPLNENEKLQRKKMNSITQPPSLVREQLFPALLLIILAVSTICLLASLIMPPWSARGVRWDAAAKYQTRHSIGRAIILNPPKSVETELKRGYGRTRKTNDLLGGRNARDLLGGGTYYTYEGYTHKHVVAGLEFAGPPEIIINREQLAIEALLSLVVSVFAFLGRRSLIAQLKRHGT